MTAVENIKINFTSEILPPPYAHNCAIELIFTHEVIELAISLVYIGREELSKEEIWEENFSGEDDFHWKGKLPIKWRGHIESLLSGKTLSNIKDSGQDIHVTVIREGNTSEIKNKQEWVYLMQELLQAAYEASHQESPLTIKVKKNKPEKVTEEYQLTYYFEFLKVDIEVTTAHGTQKLEGEWTACADFLKEIFLPDYIFEKALKKEPTQPGVFVDPGEGLWYQAGEAIKLGRRLYPIHTLETILANLVEKVHE